MKGEGCLPKSKWGRGIVYQKQKLMRAWGWTKSEGGGGSLKSDQGKGVVYQKVMGEDGLPKSGGRGLFAKKWEWVHQKVTKSYWEGGSLPKSDGVG